MTRHDAPVSDTVGSPVGSRRPGIPRLLRAAVWERDGGKCGICGEEADPLDWTCDHIIPQSLDGPTTRANLRVTHPRCNRSRTHPFKMSLEEIDEAASDWAANHVMDAMPDFQAFVDAHQTTPAVTDGKWTCRCQLCRDWRKRLSA